MAGTRGRHICLFCGEEFAETGDLFVHAGTVHVRSREEW